MTDARPVGGAQGSFPVLRLVSLCTLLCMVPLAFLTYFTVNLADQAVIREVNARMRTSSAVTSALLQQQLNAVADLTASYARRTLLVAALGDGDPTSFRSDEIDRHLHELAEAQPGNAGVFFTDTSCRLTNVQPATPEIIGFDFSFRDWCQGLRSTNRPYISDAYWSAITGNPMVVAVAVTVRAPGNGESGTPLGVIAMVYTLDAINDFTAQLALVQDVDLTITDKRGTVLAGSTNGLGTSGGLTSAAGDHRVSEALAGRSGTARTHTANREALTAFAPVDGLGWAVVAEVPAGEALEGVRGLHSAVLGLAITLGLVMLVGIVLLARTLRQRREADRALREREAKTRAILDAATDAFVSIDQAGVITGWNGRACETFGWTEVEALGRQAIDTMVPSHQQAALQADLARFQSSGDTKLANERLEITAVHRDGHEFPADVAAWPTKLGDGWGFNAFVQDITDRKATEEAMATARDRALEASQMKSEFLANMSHEIRTPMNGVLGMTSLLLDTTLTAEQREFAHTVSVSGEALLAILNDILDFSKIEAGRLDLESVDFDIRGLIEDIASLLSLPAHNKSLELACLLPVDQPAMVNGDPGRLRQIVTNLVGNAVKFTAKGEVLLELSMTEVDNETVMAHFQVVDTGIGIAPANQPAMFESFSQADAGTTRRYGGTGLGLAISRQLVELMGGEIGVRSQLGEGSTFWFTIPLRRGEPLVATAPRAALTERHMLVVDDNATNRAILIRFLRSWGIRSEAVEGGARALEVLATAAELGDPFDAVILDLNMPEMDGIDLARRIAADRRIPALRLMLLTSSGLSGEAEEAREAGVAGYLTKPVRQSHLFDCLVTVMGGPPIPTARSDASMATARPDRPGPAGHILLADDNPVNRMVASAMLERLGFHVDVVVDGAEAVAAASETRYAVILMDCQMPIKDGYEATQEIRSLHGEARRTPIIAVTASAMKSDPQRCLAAGMDDYLAKPLSLSTVSEMLDRWVPVIDLNGAEPLAAVGAAAPDSIWTAPSSSLS